MAETAKKIRKKLNKSAPYDEDEHKGHSAEFWYNSYKLKCQSQEVLKHRLAVTEAELEKHKRRARKAKRLS